MLVLAALSAAACTREPLQIVNHPSVTLSPDTVAMNLGDTVQLTATILNSTSQSVVWTSDDTTVATVSGVGAVIARGYGATSVNATTTSGDATAVAHITVVCATVLGGLPPDCSGGGFIAGVSITSLTETATGAPVDSAAVVGSIDVALNWSDTINTVPVSLFLDSDTVCSIVIHPAGSCTLNTAAFDSATGTATFANGQHMLLVKAYDQSGQTVSTAQASLTLANADTLLVSAVGAGTSTDTTGLTWQTGDLTTTALPVFYSGATADSARFTLTAKDASGTTTTVTAVDRYPGNGLSFTFPAAATPAQGGTWGLKDPAATVSATIYIAGGGTVTRTTSPFAYDAGG